MNVKSTMRKSIFASSESMSHKIFSNNKEKHKNFIIEEAAKGTKLRSPLRSQIDVTINSDVIHLGGYTVASVVHLPKCITLS